jgi:hypothetical protein
MMNVILCREEIIKCCRSFIRGMSASHHCPAKARHFDVMHYDISSLNRWCFKSCYLKCLITDRDKDSSIYIFFVQSQLSWKTQCPWWPLFHDRSRFGFGAVTGEHKDRYPGKIDGYLEFSGLSLWTDNDVLRMLRMKYWILSTRSLRSVTKDIVSISLPMTVKISSFPSGNN